MPIIGGGSGGGSGNGGVAVTVTPEGFLSVPGFPPFRFVATPLTDGTVFYAVEVFYNSKVVQVATAQPDVNT